MKIKITKPTVVYKRVRYENEELEVEESVGKWLIDRGRAREVKKEKKNSKIETTTAEPDKEEAMVKINKRRGR